MARTYDSARLRHQRRMDQRLAADHRTLARAIAGLVLRAATGRSESGTPIIPPARATRDALKRAIWEQVLKPYYIGSGTDALDGPNPRSPYALLLVEGITEATRIQVERQVAIVRRVVRDPQVLRWLTGPRQMVATREMQPVMEMGRITELVGPTAAQRSALRGPDGRIDVDRARATLVRPRGMYDPFHEWLDPNGYRLSDRIWRTSIDVRSRVDRLLDTEISRGTSAVGIADLIEPFLTPGALKGRTNTPYGSEGSYAARRLARTEITAAAGRATVNASAANPFVQGIQWRLSGSHRDIDQCDFNASGGPNGDGIYPVDQVPRYPNHPHEMCSLLPVPMGNPAELVESLRADIQAARGNLITGVSGGDARRARALQGILNPEYLTRAIMSGNLDEAVVGAVQQAQAIRLQVPVFKAAREAETWIASNLQTTINDAGKASLEVVQSVVEVVHRIEMDTGKPIPATIEFAAIKGSEYAYHSPHRQTVRFRTRYQDIKGRMRRDDDRWKKRFRTDTPFHSVSTIEGLIYHEIGHAYDSANGDTGGRIVRNLALDQKRSLFKLSGYSASSNVEGFAEAFSAIGANDERAQHVPPLLANFIKMLLGRSVQ